MSTPYLGEIRLFSFGFAPKGWAMCNGQVLAISQNAALFSLLGTYYGGDGIRTFQLPNAQGRLLGHSSSNPIGSIAGEPSVTLNIANVPQHNHAVRVAGVATTASPTGGYFATPDVNPRMQSMYGSTANAAASSQAISSTGGNLAHENRQPFLTLNYCIALQGIFPPRN